MSDGIALARSVSGGRLSRRCQGSGDTIDNAGNHKSVIINLLVREDYCEYHAERELGPSSAVVIAMI